MSAPASRLALTYSSSGKAVHDNPTRHVRQVEIEAVLREVEACGIKVVVIVAVTTVIAVRSQHHSQVTAVQQSSTSARCRDVRNQTKKQTLPAGSKQKVKDSNAKF